MFTGPVRLLRALMVSATCVALSLAAHFAGATSGVPAVPPVALAGLLAVVLLLTLALTALSGRRWTLGRSLVMLALSQAGLHAIFTVLLPARQGLASDAMASMAGGGFMASGGTMASGGSMLLAHALAGLLIGVGIAVNDSALNIYFGLASSLVGSGTAVLSPWRLARLVPILDTVALGRMAGRGERFGRWQRPRILTDLEVLNCLSRRGPPELALAS
jgi:hypothetical protein